MKMPERVRLAVDLISFLKEAEGVAPRRVEDMAAKLGNSANFLHQIVSALNKAGIVKVIRGPNGGVLPVTGDHSILEVYRAFGYMTEPVIGTTTSSTFEKELRDFLGASMI
jgi:DNA-binding IscR family transcriptional regulator